METINEKKKLKVDVYLSQVHLDWIHVLVNSFNLFVSISFQKYTYCIEILCIFAAFVWPFTKIIRFAETKAFDCRFICFLMAWCDISVGKTSLKIEIFFERIHKKHLMQFGLKASVDYFISNCFPVAAFFVLYFTLFGLSASKCLHAIPYSLSANNNFWNT